MKQSRGREVASAVNRAHILPAGSMLSAQGPSFGVALAFFWKRCMRTRVYVDGFNLYYGALKGTSFKWLNLLALSLSGATVRTYH